MAHSIRTGMKRPSIQPGLRALTTLRKEAVTQAQAALAAARDQLAEVEAQLLSARAALNAHESAPPSPPSGRVTGAAVQRAAAFMSRYRSEHSGLTRALEHCQAALAGARTRVERARDALREAQVEAKLVERHVERRQDEARRAANRRAEDEAD